MNWLQWSVHDLEKSLGGVETHARCLARELNAKGVVTAFSSRVADVSDSRWDVIHTHGDSFPWPSFQRALHKNKRRPLWVHTLHGLSYERMWKCGEYFWLGGYRSSLKEIAAAYGCDVLMTIHDRLSILKNSHLRAKAVVCGNGWDSWSELSFKDNTATRVGFHTQLSKMSSEASALSRELRCRLEAARPYFLFLGRGADRVKNTPLLKAALQSESFRLVAAPGDGFDDAPSIVKTGPLSPLEIREALELSQGLVLPSRYEGLPLVVLEALALGVPVVASFVGGVKTLFPATRGLVIVSPLTPEMFASGVRKAAVLSNDEAARAERAEHNRKVLKSWGDVARIYLHAVENKGTAVAHPEKAKI